MFSTRLLLTLFAILVLPVLVSCASLIQYRSWQAVDAKSYKQVRGVQYNDFVELGGMRLKKDNMNITERRAYNNLQRELYHQGQPTFSKTPPAYLDAKSTAPILRKAAVGAVSPPESSNMDSGTSGTKYTIGNPQSTVTKTQAGGVTGVPQDKMIQQKQGTNLGAGGTQNNNIERTEGGQDYGNAVGDGGQGGETVKLDDYIKVNDIPELQ